MAAIMVVVLLSAGAVRLYRSCLPPPKKIVVAIVSYPTGATVFVDNKYAGITSARSQGEKVLSLPVWPGTHSVRLVKHGFRTWSRSVHLSRRARILRTRLWPASSGAVQVFADPPLSEVYLDGRKRGASPIRLEGVATGPHELRVSRAGFIPDIQAIQVLPSHDLEVTVRLESKTEEYLLAQVKRSPKDFMSHVELLHIYLIQGRLDKARETLITVLRLWAKEGTDADTAARLEQEIRKAYFAEYDLGGEAALEPVRTTLEAGLEEAAFGLAPGKAPGQAAAQDGSPQAGLMLAGLLQSAEKLDKARAIYERLQSKWSGDIDVKRAYGLLLHRLQLMPEAVKPLEEVVTARPSDSLAHRALAEAYGALNRRDDALKILLHAAEIEGLPPQEKIAFETQLAGIFHSQTKFQEAAQRWEKAWPVAENPDQQAELLMAAAMEYNLAGNKKRAKELCTQVINSGAAAGVKERAKAVLAQP